MNATAFRAWCLSAGFTWPAGQHRSKVCVPLVAEALHISPALVRSMLQGRRTVTQATRDAITAYEFNRFITSGKMPASK